LLRVDDLYPGTEPAPTVRTWQGAYEPTLGRIEGKFLETTDMHLSQWAAVGSTEVWFFSFDILTHNSFEQKSTIGVAFMKPQAISLRFYKSRKVAEPYDLLSLGM
jgi:hypothetical protein